MPDGGDSDGFIWLAVLAAVAAGLLLADMLWGPASSVAWEEGWNARGALMVACGHGDRLAELQYRPFCGGCSAEAVLGAPLFRAFGPTTLAWKLVPASFHVALVAAGGALISAGRWRQAALPVTAWLLLEIAAPGWVRALGLTGWGNHAEASAIALVGLTLVAVGLHRDWWVRVAVGGVLVGLATWFSWSAGWAVPVLVGLAGFHRRPAGLVAVLAAPIGLVPAWLRVHKNPAEMADLTSFWTTLDVAPADAMARWLWTDFVQGGMWATGASGGTDPIAALWWAGLMALAAIGLATPRLASPVRRVVGLSLLALVAAWWLRYDLWDDNPAVRGFDWFNLRYRAAVWPLLAMAAAHATRRNVALLAPVVVLAAVGLGHRLNQPHTPPAANPGGWVISAEHASDPTVPSGEPHRRLARQLGRPQDVAAARSFLAGHTDPLPLCTDHHAYELGRRVGLGEPGGDLANSPPPEVEGRSAIRAFRAGVAAGAAERPQ